MSEQKKPGPGKGPTNLSGARGASPVLRVRMPAELLKAADAKAMQTDPTTIKGVFNMATFFLAAFIGFVCGLLVAALMRANDTVETCPKCQGVAGYETGPNDWHDCDMCDATGKVRT